MKMNKVIAALSVIALMFALFTVTCFATGDTATSGTTTAADTTTAAPSDTTTAAPSGTTEAAASTGIQITDFIVPAIFLAILIAVIVVFFILPKRREKTLKFFRGIRSELKKVSWYTWKQTRKGTIIVIVTVIVIAAAIGIIDYLSMNFFTQWLTTLVAALKS